MVEPVEQGTDPGPDAVTDETRRAEENDARRTHSRDRLPTPDEEATAEALGDVDPEVAAHYEEMARIGAAVKGEGEISPSP